ETGLAQAWHRYLTSGTRGDKGDKGDIAGQSVADASRTNHERDERDTSATPETHPEQHLFGAVADVADVADTDGIIRHNGHQVTGFPPRTGPGRCRGCGCHVATQGHKPSCTSKQGAPQ